MGYLGERNLKMDSSDSLILIRKALDTASNPIVAFSGGKDSTVVLDLVRQVDDNVPAIFNNTGVEYPETVRFCKTIPDLTEVKPDRTFWDCVDEYGWPMSKGKNPKIRGNACCYYLKEKPARQFYKENNIDLVFTGLTEGESRMRFMMLRHHGPYYFQKKEKVWKCHPIHDWSEDEVWDYIHQRGLPYNPIYDNGAVRCGCGPCTAYLSWKKRLARENPKLLRIVLQKQGQAQLKFDCDGEFVG